MEIKCRIAQKERPTISPLSFFHQYGKIIKIAVSTKGARKTSIRLGKTQKLDIISFSASTNAGESGVKISFKTIPDIRKINQYPVSFRKVIFSLKGSNSHIEYINRKLNK